MFIYLTSYNIPDVHSSHLRWLQSTHLFPQFPLFCSVWRPLQLKQRSSPPPLKKQQPQLILKFLMSPSSPQKKSHPLYQSKQPSWYANARPPWALALFSPNLPSARNVQETARTVAISATALVLTLLILQLRSLVRMEVKFGNWMEW